MVWGCMLWDGPGYACRIDGRMDGDLYLQILEEDLQASLGYSFRDEGLLRLALTHPSVVSSEAYDKR